MRKTRLFTTQILSIGQCIDLSEDTARHVRNVLRMQIGDTVWLFNGDGCDYVASICVLTKKCVQVRIEKQEQNETTSPLYSHLYQGICKGDKMDFVIQKSTELGVNEITPLITEFCNVKLDTARWQKKQLHWQKVANSACEQSGRSDIVTIHPAVTFSEAITCMELPAIILEPTAEANIAELAAVLNVSLCVGSEGGFSPKELELAKQHDIIPVQLGKRVLRSETAGLATLAVIQHLWGDF